MAHITESQRYTIEVMLNQGFKKVRIAEAIGKHKSVISREIKRNCDKRSGQYRHNLAEKKRKERQRNKPKFIKLTPKATKYIDEKLGLQWSPDQISKTPNDKNISMVSPETIYKYIIADRKQGGNLHKNLRCMKPYRRRLAKKDTRGKISNQINIKERPDVVEQRTEIGHFEVDLVIGAKHKGAMLTINELKTGFAIVKKLSSKNSKEVGQAIVKALRPYHKICKTITSDNGKEFAGHKYVSKELDIDYYFADPYCSWQRGANENYNGLLRQYFPKKSSFEDVTWREVKKAQKLLNMRPRKRLGYQSPFNLINSLSKVAFVA